MSDRKLLQKAVEALEPFGEAAPRFDGTWEDVDGQQQPHPDEAFAYDTHFSVGDLRRARSALALIRASLAEGDPVPEKTVTEDRGWLIERAGSWTAQPDYLAVTASGFAKPYAGCEGRFMWTTDHHHALRFAREQDAAHLMVAVRTLMGELPYRLALVDLRTPTDTPRICEHTWFPPTTKEQA